MNTRATLMRSLSRSGQNLQLLATSQMNIIGELVDDINTLIGHILMNVPALQVNNLIRAQVLQYDVLAVQRRLQDANGARHVSVGLVLDRVLVREGRICRSNYRRVVGVFGRLYYCASHNLIAAVV